MSSRKKSDTIKFYCPPMTYKLYYQDDNGGVTYDDYIPKDIIEPYRDHIAKALDKAYFFKIKYPHVTDITPGVELIDGKLYGILNVSLDKSLPRDNIDGLRDMLTEQTAKWSIYFELNRIETDGGNLYIRFYDSNEPILSEIVFKNQAYVSRHSYVFDSERYYINENAGYISNVYYNPDSNAGGQLVYNHLYYNDLKDAFDKCETEERFWERLDECARQFLTDIDIPDFADEAQEFVEEPCDFIGRDSNTMEKIREWVDKQTAEMGASQGMNMS